MKWLALFAVCLLAPLALAGIEENSRDTGSHIVYFNVFNSSFITPEVAQEYGLVRSRYRAFLNLAVHEKAQPDDQPIAVLLEGTVTNIAQQQRKLAFKKIQEGDAIYYLSDFRISDDDLLTFNIKIRTNPDSPGYDLTFQRRVYVDK